MSDYDYHPASQDESPLLAIIGDSYVEAAQVANRKSMHGLLASRFDGKGRIYGLGYSGAPLSQYLAFADFARNEFKPDAMAFVIIGNDFDESLLKYKSFCPPPLAHHAPPALGRRAGRGRGHTYPGQGDTQDKGTAGNDTGKLRCQ